MLKMSQKKGKNDNILKVAITRDKYLAQLIELDQTKPLAAIIKSICEVWGIPDSDKFSLQNEKDKYYITERNRVAIKNGDVLVLLPSPSVEAEDILSKLKSEPLTVDLTKRLATLSKDITFAQEFMNKNGLEIIIGICQKENLLSKEEIGYLLKAIVELCDSGIVQCESLEADFIKRLCQCANEHTNNVNLKTLQSSLEILEFIVNNDKEKIDSVKKEVTPLGLVSHIQESSVQTAALALINALLSKSDNVSRKQHMNLLLEKKIKEIINERIFTSSNIDDQMARELYVFQCLYLGMLDEDRKTPATGPESNTDLGILRKTAFKSEMDPQATMIRKKNYAEEQFKKLGFENTINPIEDFKEPPGRLALQAMTYFAQKYPDDYCKVVLENSFRADEHDIPFAKACIELTNKMCEILCIGDLPNEDSTLYQKMFFKSDKPFYELFKYCVLLLNKTWKEMRATSTDLPKVMNVVREQITRALELQTGSFQQFNQELGKLTFSEITRIRQTERKNKEELESQAKPIMELRNHVKPEILKLIKEQRLRYLEEGTKFNVHAKTKSSKDKCWSWKLAPNHKFFHYDFCSNEDTVIPSIERLSRTLNVSEIESIKTGRDCPHNMNKPRQGKAKSFTFSIFVESKDKDPFNFITTDEHEYNMWIDGLNVLLKEDMKSKEFEHDMNTLLCMEIKLRLLDTEGISIPENPPPLPELPPPDLDFVH